MFQKTLLLILLIVAIPTSFAAEASGQSEKEAFGLGAGALIGGLIGGPPGAILGAVGGALFGNRDSRQSDSVSALESELNAGQRELAQIRADLGQTAGIKPQNIVPARHQSASMISNNLSFSVHFRTGSAALAGEASGYLLRLARFVSALPALDVHLAGHADARGDADYNQQLSEQRLDSVQRVLEDNGLDAIRIQRHAYGETQARAVPGDVDAYALERKVTLLLSLDEEV